MTLADVLDTLPRLSLDAGRVVHPNEVSNLAYVFVDEGLVVLRVTAEGSSRRTITCHAGAGALLLPPNGGEVLVALTQVQLVPITTEICDRLLESPVVARLLLDGLAETLRQKHLALAAMSQLHHVDRVRDKLIQLARAHGRVGRDGIRLDFPLTHDLLGEMTGSARETVTRALDELQRQGFVVRHGRSYSVHVTPDELAVSPLTVRP